MNLMKKVLSLIFLISGLLVFPQQKYTISGTISEAASNETLIGVTVAVPALNTGVTTNEYGFYSNVNPDVDHPRWSQATERRISGTANKLFADRIPTRLYNGYALQVAHLYQGMDLRKWH